MIVIKLEQVDSTASSSSSHRQSSFNVLVMQLHSHIGTSKMHKKFLSKHTMAIEYEIEITVTLDPHAPTRPLTDLIMMLSLPRHRTRMLMDLDACRDKVHVRRWCRKIVPCT